MTSTEMQGAEVQAVRANKLALVERLADDLAHEIKNPLHSMVINLEVLRRRIGRLAEGEQGDLMRFAGVLGSELDRVTQRVELLLRLVRPERGAELTTLAQTIEEMLDLLELERERHGVAIDFEPAPHPLRAHLPREPVRQLALNLLLETLDVVPRGARVAIRTETLDGHAVLRLETALPESARSAAFVDPESQRILVARSLAQVLNGELQVERMDGAQSGAPSGPSFTLSIPIASR